MSGHLEQLRRLVVDRDAGLSTFLRHRRRKAARQTPGIPMGDSAASSRRAEDLIVSRGLWSLTMCHWRKRRCSATFVANMVFIARVRRECHDQALPTPGCFSIVCYSLTRRSNACSGEPNHGDAAKGRPIQLLTVRMPFWPLRWLMFNTSQSYVGSERNGRDLRQRGLLDRRNWPLLRAKSNCDAISIGWRRGPYRRSRTTAAKTENKKARTAEPVRAFLESVNLVTSASLDRSKLAGRKACKSWMWPGVQEFCMFLCPSREDS